MLSSSDFSTEAIDRMHLSVPALLPDHGPRRRQIAVRRRSRFQQWLPLEDLAPAVRARPASMRVKGQFGKSADGAIGPLPSNVSMRERGDEKFRTIDIHLTGQIEERIDVVDERRDIARMARFGGAPEMADRPERAPKLCLSIALRSLVVPVNKPSTLGEDELLNRESICRTRRMSTGPRTASMPWGAWKAAPVSRAADDESVHAGHSDPRATRCCDGGLNWRLSKASA